MSTPKDHAPIVTGFDTVRDLSRSLTSQERRPDIKRPHDLLGPGFGPHATQLLDWNSPTARFSGFWMSTDAANGPTPAGKFMGLSIATPDGHVAQIAIDHQHHPDEPNRIYVRRIHQHANQALAFTAWEPVNETTTGNRRLTTDPLTAHWVARAWLNASTVRIDAGEVAWFDSSTAEGEVQRGDSTMRPNPMVAVETVEPGTVGGFAEPGSILEVVADSGPVGVGDTLVSSTSMSARAMADNTESNPRYVIGVARSSKPAGAAGTVRVLIR